MAAAVAIGTFVAGVILSSAFLQLPYLLFEQPHLALQKLNLLCSALPRGNSSISSRSYNSGSCCCRAATGARRCSGAARRSRCGAIVIGVRQRAVLAIFSSASGIGFRAVGEEDGSLVAKLAEQQLPQLRHLPLSVVVLAPEER